MSTRSLGKGLIVLLLSLPAFALAQPASTPPGGNVNATFNSVTTRSAGNDNLLLQNGIISNPTGSVIWIFDDLGIFGNLAAIGNIYSFQKITAGGSIGKVYHLTYRWNAAEISAATPVNDGDILYRYTTSSTTWVFPTPTCTGNDPALSIGGTSYWTASGGGPDSVQMFKTDLNAKGGLIFVSDPGKKITTWSARVKCFDPTGTKSDQTFNATRWT